MTGVDDAKEPTSAELQANFTKLMGDHMQDVNKRFNDIMEHIESIETSFTTQLDAKFRELMARLPQPTAARDPHQQAFAGRAQRVSVHHGQSSTTAAAFHDEQHDEYYGADDSEGEIGRAHV